MQELRDQLNKQFDEETEYQNSEIKRGNDRMQFLEEYRNIFVKIYQCRISKPHKEAKVAFAPQ